MARTFMINTTPHEVVLGTTSVWFQPEANGAEFIQAYAELSAVQKKYEGTGVNDADAAADILDAVATFVSRFLEPDSVGTFQSIALPQRVLLALVEHLAELYGGGAEERPTGPSSRSAGRPKQGGKPGSARS